MREPWGSIVLYLGEPELNTAFGLTGYDARRCSLAPYLEQQFQAFLILSVPSLSCTISSPFLYVLVHAS